MSRPVIITCALTGGGDTTSTSPYVPVTPEQIASEALAAAAAGAAIVHIHVRDPKSGKPSRELALYRDVVERIRSAEPNLVLNLTTGAGARFMPGDDDPNHNALSGMASPEERVAHVLELKPDICSLDVATMNFGAHAFVNVPGHIERIAAAARNVGVKPELEVFDLGHVALSRHLCERGHFASPVWMQLCLGVPWGAPATTEAMLAMKQALPPGALWSAFGISRHEFSMVAQAIVLGGHVRVGLEDNLYLGPGELSPGNAPLVERAARIIRELGESVATSAQAREIIGLRSSP
jgi:uncharacterized protein (DUF849 family)